MQNISAFGTSGLLVASATFPNGFPVTQFADDADPLDTPDLDLADTAMGLNGDFIVWSRPQGIEVSVNIIPTTPDDDNFAVLFEANRIGKGKRSARDTVGFTFNYANGLIATLSEGVMVSGTALPQISSAGRFKTRMYRFRFQNISKTNNPAQ